jgi:outer membrane protein OmpA-like peptidoglycan-associated protein
MKTNSLRFRGTMTLSLSAAALALAIPAAHADRIDLGLFGGLHAFSYENELGSRDIDANDTIVGSLDVGLRVGYGLTRQLSVEGEVDFHPTKIRYTDDSLLILAYRVQGVFDLSTSAQRPFLLLGVGAATSFSDNEERIANDTDFVPHGGLGVKFDFAGGWGGRADVRLLLPPSTDTNGPTAEIEAFLGVTKSFGGDPPPPPAKDSDNDGLFDDSDQCPVEAEDMDGDADQDGCPEADAPKDSDGDGLLDDADKCPSDAEDKDGFDDVDGCPDKDNDADGIADPADQCPVEGEDKDGFADEDGCPDLDNDSDGIADAADKCPAEAEARNGFEDTDGCPDELPEAVRRYTGTIQGIQFANNSDRILPPSFPVLDKAVTVLQEFPDLRVEISGHTDNVGTREKNVDLSQRRAAAVRAYLVSKGVDESRLTSVGHGPDKPLADNKNAAGKAQNRRVEFNLIVEGGAAAE